LRVGDAVGLADRKGPGNTIPAAAVLRLERWLRTHPIIVGMLVVVYVVALRFFDMQSHGAAPLAVTYAVPLSLAGYGVGLLAGAVAAVVVTMLWVFDALSRGLVRDEVAYVFTARLLTSLAIVSMGAIAAAAARARERYVEASRQLEKLRTDLVSAFSHDLRSPLTVIMGYTEMLQQTARDSDTVEALERILLNANHLDHLVGDVLSAGHGDTSLPLHVSAFTPDDLVNELRTEFDYALHKKDVVLVWSVSPGIPALHTDRRKLASVVRNLVNNALKFTARGKVEVRIGHHPESNLHRIEVEDTGPGIPDDALSHVFDRFFRADGAQHTTGFGLGLFIVKRFMDLLGGSVTVRSRVGEGSCFAINVPALADQERKGDVSGPEEVQS
jgi:signal transduction histidine kinase